MKRISLVVAAALAATVVAVTSALAGSAPVRIAFVKETGSSLPAVWVANGSGGGKRKLGNGDEPLISPNGAFVAAGSFASGSQLKVFGSSGGVHNLFKTAKFSAAPLAWSPNSRYLAVAVMSNKVNEAGSYLAVVNTATWSITKVASGVIGGASFSPSGAQIVLSKWHVAYTFNANLFTVNVDGSHLTQITFGNNAQDPVWGRKGIVFSREGKNRYYMGQPYGPSGQLWLKSGSHLTQLTHVSVGLLVYGLTPVGVSANGNRILAAFTGEDTDYAVAVQISPRIVHNVNVGVQYAVPGAISKDGKTLLISYGSFEAPANDGSVDTVPFLGTHRTVLVQGAEGTWDK